MNNKREKTPEMKEGMEKELMKFILSSVKNTKGLTSYLDKYAGINGKWIKTDLIYNLRCTLLLKIILYMFHFMDEDTIRQFWNNLFDRFYHLARTNAKELGTRSKKTQNRWTDKPLV